MMTPEIIDDWNKAKDRLNEKWAAPKDGDLLYAEERYEGRMVRIQNRMGETRKAVKESCSACRCD